MLWEICPHTKSSITILFVWIWTAPGYSFVKLGNFYPSSSYRLQWIQFYLSVVSSDGGFINILLEVLHKNCTSLKWCSQYFSQPYGHTKQWCSINISSKSPGIMWLWKGRRGGTRSNKNITPIERVDPSTPPPWRIDGWPVCLPGEKVLTLRLHYPEDYMSNSYF